MPLPHVDQEMIYILAKSREDQLNDPHSRATDAYALVHELKRRLCASCVPAFTTDGLRAYFHAVTAHFGRWSRPPRARKDHWQVDEHLLYGQLVKRRQNRKVNYTITRMLWGQRGELYAVLEQYGFNRLVQTSFIERVNLTIRQGVSLLTRRTWSLAQTEDHLLHHVQWWRCYYHFIRPHESLYDRTPDIPRSQRDRTRCHGSGINRPHLDGGGSATPAAVDPSGRFARGEEQRLRRLTATPLRNYQPFSGGAPSGEIIYMAEETNAAGWLIWTAFDFPTDATCIPPHYPHSDNAEHHFGLWDTDFTPKPVVSVLLPEQ